MMKFPKVELFKGSILPFPDIMVTAMCVCILYIQEDGCFMAQVVFGGKAGAYILWQAIDLSMLVRRFSLEHLRRFPYRNWLLGYFWKGIFDHHGNYIILEHSLRLF